VISSSSHSGGKEEMWDRFCRMHSPLPETLLCSTFEEPGLFNSELALVITLPINGRLFSAG
jgi:hypothetical protein